MSYSEEKTLIVNSSIARWRKVRSKEGCTEAVVLCTNYHDDTREFSIAFEHWPHQFQTMKDALIPQQANKYFCSSFTLILKDLSCVEWISANPCASSSFLSRTFSKFQIVNFWEQGLYFLFDISYEPCTTEDTPVLLGCSVKLTTQDPCPLSQLVLASLSGQGIFIEGSL